MKLYWYAPFDNASESELAVVMTDDGVVGNDAIDLTVQSCSHRFGAPLDTRPLGRYALVRDLPPPAGELGKRRTPLRQLMVVLQRSVRRRRLIRAGDFGVVHLHTFNLLSDWVALPRLRRLSPLLVQSVHDVRPQRRRLPRRIETALLSRGYRACDGIIVAHPYLRTMLVEQFGVEERRVRIVPLPVLTLPGLSQRPRRAPGAPLQVLFFGTLRENKGMRVLFDAISMSEGESGLQFTIAGRGDPGLEDAVRRCAARDPRVTAEVGYISDQRRQQLLEASDVLVLPYTRFNSQSGVLSRDAYGSCTPVVASRIGALGEAVESEGTGWLVTPGDSTELAATLELVRRSPDEYNRRVEMIRSIAATRTLQQTAVSIGEAYTYFSALQR